MKKKLKLDALEIQSFVTTVNKDAIKGAGTEINCNTWYSALQCLRTTDCTLDIDDCIAIQVSGLCVTHICPTNACTGTGPI